MRMPLSNEACASSDDDTAHRLTAIADHQGSRVTKRASDSCGTLVSNFQRNIASRKRVQQVTGAK